VRRAIEKLARNGLSSGQLSVPRAVFGSLSLAVVRIASAAAKARAPAPA
jgi:hypothetical protein